MYKGGIYMEKHSGKYGIGKRIAKCREDNKYSQKQLASILGVRNTVLSNWEQGLNRPNLDQFCKLCQVLHIMPSQLLGMVSYEEKLVDKDYKLLNAYHKLKPEEKRSVDELLKIYDGW